MIAPCFYVPRKKLNYEYEYLYLSKYKKRHIPRNLKFTDSFNAVLLLLIRARKNDTEGECLLEHGVVFPDRNLSTFQRCLLPS
jgi:hypothetical protein